jgi:hypothetical protein
MGVNIFHGYGFGIAKPGGFVPVAISTACMADACPEAAPAPSGVDLSAAAAAARSVDE